MSFADLRQKVIQAHCLNTARFAEAVQIGAPDDSETLLNVRAKIEHEQAGPQRGSGAASTNEQRRGTFDERERIKVTVSRDASWQFAYPQRPQPATVLYRAAAIDADRRPFTFRGEVVYEGDQHAVYFFERPRRFGQGRGS
jgi:hypothetical protein